MIKISVEEWQQGVEDREAGIIRPQPPKLCEHCPQPGQPAKDDGYFRWFGICFDLRIVLKLLKAQPREALDINREYARGFGLIIDPDEIAHKQAHGITRIGLRTVDEEHLAHIPAECLKIPGIIAPIIVGDVDLHKKSGKRGGRTEWKGPEASWMLIDGGHRLTRLFREGAEIADVYALTAQESLQAQGYLPHKAAQFVVANKAAFADWPAEVREIAGVEHLFL